jgi:hypothetical protein
MEVHEAAPGWARARGSARRLKDSCQFSVISCQPDAAPFMEKVAFLIPYKRIAP